MHKILNTTDGRFVGQDIDDTSQLIHLGDYDFIPDKRHENEDGTVRLSNSNYVIDCK